MANITLTIDNGPHRHETRRVLSVLADRQVHAHFFVVGSQASKPGGLDILDDIKSDGHVVGNHTWSHQIPFGDNISEDAVQEEVARTSALLAPYLSAAKKFRPFGGGGRLDPCLFSPALITHLCEEEYTCVLWNNVPRDWENLEGWVATALANIQLETWSVVVVHDYIEGNAKYIGAFIDAARAAGHEFVDEISPQCLPIVDGVVVQDLAPWTTVR
jgi:peptidoglycan/xylan/chitin deacetylase (PgdA/CDA1 family)